MIKKIAAIIFLVVFFWPLIKGAVPKEFHPSAGGAHGMKDFAIERAKNLAQGAFNYLTGNKLLGLAAIAILAIYILL